MMQILEIVLYSKKGEKRIISFKKNRVNIVLGQSGTGKSVLSDIVEYCMGSNHCNIAEGIIREKVSWFGIRVQFASDQAFIARENPGYGKQSTNHSYMEMGDVIESPQTNPEKSNTTSDAIVEFLSNKIGIVSNESRLIKDPSAAPLVANIKHTFFYLFQEQDEIATNKFLFHRQSEPMMQEIIKLTLPFFLGVIEDDRLQLQQDLLEIKRDLNKALREFDDAESIKNKTNSQISELLSEAYEVGLIENRIEKNQDPISALKAALNWNPKSNDKTIIPEDRISQLSSNLSSINNKIRDISEEINQAKVFTQESNGYSSEVDEQILRLKSIGLFSGVDCKNDLCPICSQKIANPTPSVTKINESIRKLSKNLEFTEREKPKLESYIKQKEIEKKKMQRTADEIAQEIRGFYKENDAAQRYQDLNIRIGRVLGRISSYFDSVKIIDDDSSLKDKIDELSRKQKLLEEKLDPQLIEDNLNHALDTISYNMTTYAQTLNLEHSHNLVKLDLKRVTVVVNRDDKPITLQQMGSAANFLGYHLATLFALHKYFRTHTRPIPQFLFLDQVSQVYYPADSKINDVDRESTKKIFNFIFTVCQEIDDNFQIILTEHAEFPDKWYQDAIVERLDKENALIPKNW
jgi:hypothetical protein